MIGWAGVWIFNRLGRQVIRWIGIWMVTWMDRHESGWVYKEEGGDEYIKKVRY